MTNKTTPRRDAKYNLVFLFPGIYRPLKANFAGEFEQLSATCAGYIFTMCSESQRDVKIGNFHLYSGQLRSSAIRDFLGRLWIQFCLPVWLLWPRSRVDAIITWDPYASGFAGILLKFLFRTKLIIQVVGDYHKMDPTDDIEGEADKQNQLLKNVKKWVMGLVFQLAIRCADAVKVVNSDLEKFFRDRWPNKRLYRFPCFVANDYFQSLAHRQGDYLLSIGYPFYRKGVDIVIRAFALLSKKYPAIKLRIMGFAREEELRRHRQMGNDDPKIEFVKPGWIEDVGEELKGCYALVHAARSDAAPRVLFEAMACRKPIVSSRCNGAVDYVQDGETGWLCTIGDVGELAKALDALLSDPKLAEQMGQAGFERLQKEFSEEAYIRSVLSMVDEVVNPKNGTSPTQVRGQVKEYSTTEGVNSHVGRG